MVSRPLLYLSLPGIALILGVFWFRRRNKHIGDEPEPNADDNNAIISGKSNSITTTNKQKCDELESKSMNLNKLGNDVKQSRSMNINGKENLGRLEDEDNPAIKLFGKSAPIRIVQNGRPSPIKPTQQHNQQPLDTDLLKAKIQNVEQKVLRSIDEDFENLSSPIDLPDSVNHKISFYNRNMNNNQKDEPVVIRATGTPKISPENSFMETKYTKECEQNNNNNNNINNNEKQLSSSPSTTQKDIDGFIDNIAKKMKNPVSQSKRHRSKKNQNTQMKTTKEEEEDTIDEDMSNNNHTHNNKNEKRNVNSGSPSLSICSEQSGDSGKGSSLPRSEENLITSYEFFFPGSLLGHLYGRKKSFLQTIKNKTNAKVSVHHEAMADKLHVCLIEGTESEVTAALAMIRSRFPIKIFPNLTLQRIHFALPQTIVPLSKENLFHLRLPLIEGINNDVVVSSVCSGNQIFVQQPLHPSHLSFAVLQKYLYDSYTETEAPMLPSIEMSAVCVLLYNGLWYRVQIVKEDPDDVQRCIVQFLDFGGYVNVHFNDLRQIRSDFMGVPFQATECLLSNIEPIGSTWTPEASDILSKLINGIVLQAQIAGYNNDNIPEIYLFACLGPNNVIFINKELVGRNLARWVDVRD